ncbi:MAG: aminoglycoside 6-adenylyltransferase [bacterium]|jgi:aminoglycoside 6-adenylyltransferase
MRTEREMYDLILGVARKDARIRAVYLNGSRANPAAPRDIFQDYDIVYVVTETEPFIRDKNWLAVFGETVVMQEPDNTELFDNAANREEKYAYLMQFTDGNRVDLTVQTKERTARDYTKDKLTVPLLDKDGFLPPLPPPTDSDYRVKKPSAKLFTDCCNEFWWVTLYVAKGLRRREILYALDHLNSYVRPMLLLMLEWYVGVRTDFTVNIGKSCKYLERYLPEETWARLLATYPVAAEEPVWEALFNMGSLFRETANLIAGRLGYLYNREEDEKTAEYLSRLRQGQDGAAGGTGSDCTEAGDGHDRWAGKRLTVIRPENWG